MLLLLKILSSFLSLVTAILLFAYSDSYVIHFVGTALTSQYSWLFLLIPVVFPLLDLLGFIPARYSIISFLPAVWFSGLWLKVLSVEMNYLDFINLGPFKVQRIWSFQEKMAWLHSQPFPSGHEAPFIKMALENFTMEQLQLAYEVALRLAIIQENKIMSGVIGVSWCLIVLATLALVMEWKK